MLVKKDKTKSGWKEREVGINGEREEEVENRIKWAFHIFLFAAAPSPILHGIRERQEDVCGGGERQIKVNREGEREKEELAVEGLMQCRLTEVSSTQRERERREQGGTDIKWVGHALNSYTCCLHFSQINMAPRFTKLSLTGSLVLPSTDPFSSSSSSFPPSILQGSKISSSLPEKKKLQ